MTDAADDVDPNSARRRHREWELDLFIAHELASASPAAAVLWQAVGQEPPLPPIEVLRQTSRDDTRTTDVEAVSADGRALLCENKAAGGSFEHRQPESYAAHCEGRDAWAVTIGPASWIATADTDLFHAAVAVEALVAALDEAAAQLDGSEAELRESYRYRAQELRKYAEDPGYVGNPNEQVAAIGALYRRLLADRPGRLALADTALRSESAEYAYFRGFTDVPGQLIHKMVHGWVDLTAPGFTLAELGAAIAALDADERPPDGWEVSPQATKTAPPALRLTVNQMQPKTIDQADAEPVLIQIITQIEELDAWLVRVGAALLQR